MQERIDKEVKKIIDSCYKQARVTLAKARRALDTVAQALVERETLERDDFEKLVGPKPTTAPAFVKV